VSGKPTDEAVALSSVTSKKRSATPIIARTATVAGWAFVAAAGAALSVLSFSAFNFSHVLPAAVVCSVFPCETTDPSPLTPPNLDGMSNFLPALTALPEARFITTPPSTVWEPSQIVVEAKGVKRLSVLLEPTFAAPPVLLSPVSAPVNGRHTFMVSGALAPEGEYQLRARAVSLQDGRVVYYSGPRLHLARPAAAAERAETMTRPVPVRPISPPPIALPSPPILTDSDAAGEAPALALLPTEDLARPVLRVEAPGAEFVEIYARPADMRADKELFLGLARRTPDGSWLFSPDPASLLPGTYTIYARVKNDFGLVLSAPTALSVRARAAAAPREVPPTGSLALDEAPPEIVPEPTPPRAAAIAPAASDIKILVRRELEREQGNISTLLRRYAAASAAGDQVLLKSVKDELSAVGASMTERAERASVGGVSTDELQARFQVELTRAKARAELFERLVGAGAAADAAPAITPPELPEHPAALRFTSPREFGIVRDDILAIEVVVPVIETDAARGTPRVQAEIRGRALPDSVVKLFIFSAPIVVSVRTESDGSFVYRFDRELEDGTHEVYVAMTDARGEILAKSNPFRFIKTAEAFTPLQVQTDAAAPLASDPAHAPQTQTLYHIIAVMAVLSLGFILLLLGLFTRRTRSVSS
jgi:hypothetical protein